MNQDEIADVELEESIIGRLIFINNEILLIADKLKDHHFHDNACSSIFSAMIQCLNKTGIIDMSGIRFVLKEKNIIISASRISSIIDKSSNIRSIDEPVNRLIKLWKQRELEHLAKKILSRKIKNTENFTQDKLYEIMSEGGNTSEKIDISANKALNEVEARVSAFRNNERLPNTIYSGLTDLDNLTGGFRPGEFYVLAGRPGMGKSSAKRTMAIHISEDFPIKIFSKEMIPSEISNLMACSISEIDSAMVRRGTLNDYELDRYTHAIQKTTKLNIEFDIITDLTNFSVSVKKWRMRTDTTKPAVVFIDYLQQMISKGNYNKHLEIAEITTMIKQIAITQNICIIALAQLSRSVETRGGDKRPILSDLRESGNIEQDADGVIFIYRPEYYGFETDENGNSSIGLAEFDIAKFRGGIPGVVKTEFVGKYGKFIDWRYTEHEYKKPSF